MTQYMFYLKMQKQKKEVLLSSTFHCYDDWSLLIDKDCVFSAKIA